MRGDIFGKARAKKAALRHNHPSRNVRLVLIAGDYGATTTALYFGELLREAGETVAVFTSRTSHINGESYAHAYDASADAIQRAISKSRKSATTVIMAATPALLRSHALETLQCEMTILTSDGELAREIAEHPAAFVVLPETMSSESLNVSPHQMISFGDSELAEARVRNVVLYRRGTEVEMTIDHQTNLTLSTHLLGRANAYNIAAAVAGSYLLGIDIGTFQEGTARLEHVTGNLEQIEIDQPYSVYVDAATQQLSADLVSSSMKQLSRRRLLIACDDSFDNDTLELLGQRADHVTVAGGEEIHGRYHADDHKHAVELTLRSAKKDDTVLLLGTHFTATPDGSMTIGEKLVREVLSA